VVVGDVNTADVVSGSRSTSIRSSPGRCRADLHRRARAAGERRVTISKEGTTAYLKIGYHAPAIADDDFFPMLVLDAVLTGAKGINLWASFRTPPPQRSARLYKRSSTPVWPRGERRIPADAAPFLYTLSLTATEGVALKTIEDAVLAKSIASVSAA
jgi:zinc protease